MVWNALQSLSFSNQNALRAVDINYLIEATYYLAPNYWEEVGDLAVGLEDKTLGRLEHAAESDLCLINDVNGPSLVGLRWGDLSNYVVQYNDVLDNRLGSNTGYSIVVASTPILEYYRSFERTATDYQELAGRTTGDVALDVRISNGNSSVFRLYWDEDTSSVKSDLTAEFEGRLYARLYLRRNYPDITLSSILPDFLNVFTTDTAVFTRFRSVDLATMGGNTLADLSVFTEEDPPSGSGIAGLGERAYHMELFMILVGEW